MEYPSIIVITCSTLVGLIRIHSTWTNCRRFLPWSRGLGEWRVPVILALTADIAPLIPSIVSIATAAYGLNRWSLSVQLVTLSMLSIYDLSSSMEWWTRLRQLGSWQKLGAYTVVTLSLGGAMTAVCLPTPYTTFTASILFGTVYAYLTRNFWGKCLRWIPYLAFSLLLFAGTVTLGVLVFRYKMPQLSDYLFLPLNVLHPRTVFGYISIWKDPSTSVLNKDNSRLPPTSTSDLIEDSSRSNSINPPASSKRSHSLHATEIDHSIKPKSSYNHRGKGGEGFDVV